MIDVMPAKCDAPRQILLLDGNCGPIAAWGILKYFRRRASASRIIAACGHTRAHGTFAIGLAVALREHGLSVVFHSECDPQPEPIEARCYRIADQIGVVRRPALELDDLLALISPERVPIILYNTDQNEGHFSPVVGVEGDQVLLPYSDERLMSKDELKGRWSAPEIYRQCILASHTASSG